MTAETPSVMSRDPRLANRDHTAWAAARALRNAQCGHRANRPGVPGPVPKPAVPHLRRRRSVVPALERPRARPRWDEVI